MVGCFCLCDNMMKILITTNRKNKMKNRGSLYQEDEIVKCFLNHFSYLMCILILKS